MHLKNGALKELTLFLDQMVPTVSESNVGAYMVPQISLNCIRRSNAKLSPNSSGLRTSVKD